MSIVKHVGAALGLALALYGAAVFISLEPDVREWSPYGRAIFVCMWAGVSVAAFGFSRATP